MKDKYPEIQVEIIEDEKLHYIEREGKKWIPLEILGEMAGFETPQKSAYKLYKRKSNNSILIDYSTSVKLALVENGVVKRRNVICLDIEGARLFMMLARTPISDKWKRIFAKLLNYVPEPIALSVGQPAEDLPDQFTNLSAAEILNKQLAILIEEQKRQNQEIQKTKEIAETALARTEYITQGEFWNLFNKIRQLKAKGDKTIWRDVERVFRISNLGQLPACEYEACLQFLRDREIELFKNQPKLSSFK